MGILGVVDARWLTNAEIAGITNVRQVQVSATLNCLKWRLGQNNRPINAHDKRVVVWLSDRGRENGGPSRANSSRRISYW